MTNAETPPPAAPHTVTPDAVADAVTADAPSPAPTDGPRR